MRKFDVLVKNHRHIFSLHSRKLPRVKQEQSARMAATHFLF